MTGGVPSRDLRITFQPSWDPGGEEAGCHGLFTPDPRVRTLLKVLVSYGEVRYVVPDRVSLDAATDPRLLDTIQRFLERQAWLVKSVALR